jgi:TonB family protein
MNSLDQFSMLASQLKAGGGKFETFETGPTLLSTEDQNDGKVELTVERDDLAGDEDQIEVALHITKDFKEESLPFIPRFTFLMAQQADIWRLNEIDITVKVPLSDPTFLNRIDDHQRSQNEMITTYEVQSIVSAEKSYSAAHGGYACSLSALGSGGAGTEHRSYLFDRQLISGKKNGYIFVISNCDTTHYKVVAEPEAPNSGQRAFCSDEGGTVRASADGKATTCLSSGETVREGGENTSVGVSIPSSNAAGTDAPPSSKPAQANSRGNSLRSTPGRVRVSAAVIQGLLISKVNPNYPAEAKAARVQGTVVVHAIIATDGSIQSVDVISRASPLLNQAALDAVKQWKYRPYLLNGTPVEVDTQMNLSFTLVQH